MFTGDVFSVSLRCYTRGDCKKKEAKEEMLEERKGRGQSERVLQRVLIMPDTGLQCKCLCKDSRTRLATVQYTCAWPMMVGVSWAFLP